MPRSIAVYLTDILEACDAIDAVFTGVDLDTYLKQRWIRSSVEREFIIIREAVAGIRRERPEIAERISDARVIVGFRNVLKHNYVAWTMRRCTVWPQRISAC